MITQKVHNIVVNWSPNNPDWEDVTPLCDLYYRNGSDKSLASDSQHNYSTLYYKLFKLIDTNNYVPNLFELGLGTNNTSIPSTMGITGSCGGSLASMYKFFEGKANIYGADIDKEIVGDNFDWRKFDLPEPESIKTFYCDQTNQKSIRDMWRHSALEKQQMDIIIEDGLHKTDAIVNFVRNSVHKLALGGIYVAEDLPPVFWTNARELTFTNDEELAESKHKQWFEENNIMFSKIIKTGGDRQSPIWIMQKAL